jgi:hypothetical protein
LEEPIYLKKLRKDFEGDAAFERFYVEALFSRSHVKSNELMKRRVKFCIENHNIPQKEIIAVGNAGKLSMIEYAGLGVWVQTMLIQN